MASKMAEGEQNEAPAPIVAPVPSAHTPLLRGLSGRQMHTLSSVNKSFCNIFISIVGAGVLGMPYTFKQSGWLCGALALALVGFACFHSMMLLVTSKRRLERDGNDSVHSFSDLGLVTFGKTGQLVVDCVIILSQGGFCVAYLIFIGENLASVFTATYDGSDPGPNSMASAAQGFGSKVFGLSWKAKAIYVWIVLPLQIWLASIRSLTHLAPFSMFADVANVAAMLVVMGNDGLQLFEQHGIQKVDAFTGWSSLPFVMGVAIYAFEGFGLVIPIEGAMKDRSKFGITLASAMASITTLFIIFASLGYFAFGEETKDIITLNLEESWQTDIIKLALCLGLFFTFPVMMHPVHEVIARRFHNRRPSFALRTITVFAIASTAVSVPHFGDFLSLMGSSVCCVLSFVFPSLFHLRIHTGELRWGQIATDCSFIAFGVCFGCWGTWTAVQNWS